MASDMKYPTSLFSSNLKFDGENNSGGVLSIAGCSAEKLVKEYGSPLFVIDQADFYVRTNAWRSADYLFVPDTLLRPNCQNR